MSLTLVRCQFRLDNTCEKAGAIGKRVVIEVVVWIVKRVGSAVSDNQVTAWYNLRHVGEILGTGARRTTVSENAGITDELIKSRVVWVNSNLPVKMNRSGQPG